MLNSQVSSLIQEINSIITLKYGKVVNPNESEIVKIMKSRGFNVNDEKSLESWYSDYGSDYNVMVMAWEHEHYDIYTKVISRSVDEIVSKHGDRLDGVRILDFGCGCGYAGLTYARMGADVTFVEINPKAVDIINSVSNPGSIEILNRIPDDRFDYYDAVTTFAAMEHVYNPSDVLIKFYDILKVSGLFIDWSAFEVVSIDHIPSDDSRVSQYDRNYELLFESQRRRFKYPRVGVKI